MQHRKWLICILVRNYSLIALPIFTWIHFGSPKAMPRGGKKSPKHGTTAWPKLKGGYVGLLFTQKFNFNRSDILTQCLHGYSFEESEVSALWIKIHFFRSNEHWMNNKMGPYFGIKVSQICLAIDFLSNGTSLSLIRLPQESQWSVF